MESGRVGKGIALIASLALTLALFASGAAAQGRIVSSSQPRWAAGEGWRLGGSPVLELGSSGSSEEEFGDIQALARLSDGSVVVADRMAGELRLFDPRGRFVRRIGRSGEGPGEFKGIASLQLLAGDSMAVYDPPLRRWTVLATSGEVLESRTFRFGDLPGVGVAYRHDDGDFTIVGSVLIGPGGEPGYFDTTRPLFQFETAEERLRSTGQVPGTQSYRTKNGALGRALVLRSGSVAIGSRIFVGDGRTWDIEVLARDGTTLETWRRSGVDLSLSDERLRRAETHGLERVMENAPQALARWRRLYAEVPPPASLPAYSGFLLDTEGFLWVRGYSLTGEPQAPWSVFDPSGTYLGDVPVPEGLDLKAVTARHVLGVWRDEFDVQHVRVYEITGRR